MPSLKNALISSICAALAVTAIPDMSFAAKAAKKDKRSMMTDAQKKELRRRGREWCLKNHAKGSAATIDRIEILTDGSIRCWYFG
jgi:hypothetical protein